MSRLPRPQAKWRPADFLPWMMDVSTRPVTGSFTWNPASIGATTTADTTLAVASYPSLKGLRAGMPVVVTPPSTLDAGLIIGASWIAADDTLTIRLRNTSGSAVDQASGTWAFFSWIL